MLPRFSIDSSCLTITWCLAIALAPAASTTLVMAGNNCGVMPTARARPTISDSTISFRCQPTFTANTTTVMVSTTLTSNWPKWRRPRSNPVSGCLCSSRSEILPNSVSGPVRTTTAVANPLMTLVPRKTEFTRWPSGVGSGSTPHDFSAGKLSPVSTASFTNRSRAVSSRQSPGMRSPARKRTTSPGTTASSGTS